MRQESRTIQNSKRTISHQPEKRSYPGTKKKNGLKKRRFRKKIINENDRYDNRHDSFPMRQPEETITTLISLEYIHTYKQPQIFTQLPNEST